MSQDKPDSQPLDLAVNTHERTLPIYPSTAPAAALGASENTHISEITGVTTRVSDYGRGLKQRNEAGQAFSTEPTDDILAGIEGSDDVEPILRPDVINDEDLTDRPKEPIKTLLNAALQLDRRNNEKRFLPSGDLRNICNHTAVQNELERQYDKDRAEDYAAYVCNSKKPAREIFAVLVLVNYLHFLPEFISAELADENLPFSGNEQQTELWSKHKGPIRFFHYPQDAEVIREFYIKQWWVHIPFLGRDKDSNKAINFKFELGTVMPWTSVGERDETGGFGVVEKVRIHKDHHSFTKYESFALKTLTSGFDDDYKCFQREIAAFRRMSPGPHLVELCATLEITAGRNFMLLFPWAEGGSLEGLMAIPRKDVPGASDLASKDFVLWIATQCRGLVDALETIHYTRVRPSHGDGDGDEVIHDKDYGIHGDIKPANILYFSQEKQNQPLGTLKVADFGLMTFHTRASRSKKNRRTAYAASQTYRSPEHDIGYFMSKKVDVWALGCVFSQLLTWVILHHGACKEYQEARMQEPSYSGAARDKGRWREDNFFLKHIQKLKKAGNSSLVSPSVDIEEEHHPDEDPPKGNKVKTRIDRLVTKIVSFRFGPDHFEYEEVPRLKVSVSKWIHKLTCNAQHDKGPTFLTDFLQFIKNEMLHPERIPRADCKRTLGFFDAHIAKGLDNDWYFTL